MTVPMIKYSFYDDLYSFNWEHDVCIAHVNVLADILQMVLQMINVIMY